MLQNAYFLAKIGADTAENEQHFAEISPTDAGARGRRRRSRAQVAGAERAWAARRYLRPRGGWVSKISANVAKSAKFCQISKNSV